jgi:hypothetical protein
MHIEMWRIGMMENLLFTDCKLVDLCRILLDIAFELADGLIQLVDACLLGCNLLIAGRCQLVSTKVLMCNGNA